MLRNPYLNRSMIRSVDEFYGRGDPLARTAARIGAPTPQSISLVGERRAGKSSLLWHLAQPTVHTRFLDEPQRYVFLMMDFQGQQHLDPSGFCRAFGEQLQEAVPADLPALPALSALSDLSDLQSAIHALSQAGLRLVCLFDEFEMITRNPEFGAPFFGFLRSLANTHPVAFVTASRRPLETLCHNEEIAASPFFNIFTQVHIGPMPADEVQQLIAEPSAQAGLPLEPHAQTLLSLAGHLPFFVQIACSAAFDHLSQGDGSFDEQAVERRFAEETTSHFRYLWDRLEDTEASAVAALAGGASLDEDQREALDALIDDGYIIARDDGYQLFSTAFVRFVRKYAAESIPKAAAVQEPSGKRSAPKRLLWLAGGILLLLVALALAFYLLRSDNAPIATSTMGAVQTPQGLQLSLVLTNAPDAIPLSPLWSASQHRNLLSGADRLQLDVQTDQPGFLYAYQLGFDGEIVHLADATDPTPLAMKPGRAYTLPSEREFIVDWTVPLSALYFVFLPERDRELEELYQRLARVPATKKDSYRHRLVGRIARRAAKRIELPLAAEVGENL